MTTAMQETQKDSQLRRVRPTVDVFENDAEYKVYVELPGVKNEDIELILEQDALRLKARRHAHVHEPVLYDRSFNLPEVVDREQVGAALAQGVLTLTLPKRPSQQPRQIQVKAA